MSNSGIPSHESEAARFLARPAAALVLLPLAAIILLHGCWDAPPFSVDDHQFTLTAAAKPWTALLSVDKATPYPATLLSFKLDCVLFGPKGPVPSAAEFVSGPEACRWGAAFRVMNGVYHLLAALVLWWLLRRLGCGAGVSLAVSFLWAVHPMACESVCWIAERKNVLAALFAFAALAAWTVDRRRWWRGPLCWLFCALGLLSKSSVLGVLPLLVLFEIFDPREGGFRWREVANWRRLAPALLAPSLLAVAGFLHGRAVFNADLVDPPGGSLWTALLTDVHLCARYFENIFWPLNLSFYYGVEPVVSVADPRLWLGGAGVCAVMAALILLARKERRGLAVLGLCWFFCGLAPNSNFVATAFPMQDRFVYFGLPGLLLALALGAEGLAARSRNSGLAVRGAVIGFAGFLAVLAALHSPLYRSSDLLEADAAGRQPNSACAQLTAARILKARAFRHLPGGAEPNAVLASKFTGAALKCYAQAESCPDVRLFSDALAIRVAAADLLLKGRRPEQARELLDGWLPPPHMKILATRESARHLKRAEFYACYRPATLALGLEVWVRAVLEEAAAPGATPAQAVELCRQAAATAGQVAKLIDTGETKLRQAEALLACAKLEAENNPELSRQHHAQAAGILETLKADPAFHSAATNLLSKAIQP